MKRFLTFAFALAISVLATAQKRHFNPGDTIPEAYIAQYGDSAFFRSTPIPDTVFARMQGKSFKKNCTVPRDSLRYITCLHKDIKGNILVGEMVVNKSIAKDVLEIFRELYDKSYPVQRMLLVDNYNADDETSMRANNSSSFNFRFISHTTKVSKHGKGIAVDINPLYNPYVKVTNDGKRVVEPAPGVKYIDRSKEFPYKIKKGDACYKAFIAHGFSWGGEWRSCKDYQHFEK